jgi:hypothetical protein
VANVGTMAFNTATNLPIVAANHDGWLTFVMATATPTPTPTSTGTPYTATPTPSPTVTPTPTPVVFVSDMQFGDDYGDSIDLRAMATGNKSLALPAKGPFWHYKGSVAEKWKALGTGTNGATETVRYVDDTPAGEWSAVDGDVTVSTDTNYIFGRESSGSLKLAFAATATSGDGALATIATDNLESNEYISFPIYSTEALSSGDVQLVLTDDGGDRTFDFAVSSKDTWTWIDVDISSLTGGTGDVVSKVKLLLTSQGAANLGAFTLYVGPMFKWDTTDEEALGADVYMDSVHVFGGASAGWTNPTVLTELTDYFVRYNAGGTDSLVWISDQFSRTNIAKFNYQ